MASGGEEQNDLRALNWKRVWLSLAIALCGVSALFAPLAARHFSEASRLEREVDEAYGALASMPFRWETARHKTSIPSDSAAPDLASLRRRAARLMHEASADSRSLILNARLALLSGDAEAAVRIYRRAQALAPDNSGLDSELAAAFALRAESEKRDSDYEAALESVAKAAARDPESSSTAFNLAAIAELVPLRLTAERWYGASLLREKDPAWREETARRRSAVLEAIEHRRRMIDLVRDAGILDPDLWSVPGALEVRQQEAIRTWIGQLEPPMPALRQMAALFLDRHGDRWWSDFLKGPVATEAWRLLSQAHEANSLGDHARAEALGTAAETMFRKEKNDAGRMWARRVRIEASHRGDAVQHCPGLLQGFEEEAARRGYEWLRAQTPLDVITCRTASLAGASLADRERAAVRVAGAGFEGAALRALAFLTEPWVMADSPVRTWARGREVMRRYALSAVPGYRAYHVCWDLAEAARIAGADFAARVLLEEAAAELEDNENLSLRAAVQSDIAAVNARLGLHDEASQQLREAERLLAGSEPNAAMKYRFQIGIERALGALSNGRADDALSQLRAVENHRIPEQDRADYLNAFGLTMLALGRFGEAESRFRELLRMTAPITNAVPSPIEQNSMSRLYDASQRGLAEAELRGTKDPARALETWLAQPGGEELAGRPSTGLLLVYAFLPNGVSAWLSDGATVEHRWLAENEVRAAAAGLIGLAPDADASPKTVEAAARQAGAVLLAPFQQRVRAQEADGEAAPLLTIVADGVLEQLPWSAVRFADGGAVIERFAIVQRLRHSRPVTEQAPAIQASARAVVFADPTQGGPDAFRRLDDAMQEGLQVAQRFRSALLFVGGAATGERLAAEAPGAAVLHFAGHGISNGGLGALAVAGAPGWVTAGQIASLDLTRVRLVMLSSCSSGIGSETGPISADLLVRGFLDAGAARVIAASWPVDSTAAAVLSDRFYEQLLAGQLPAEALRRAVLALRSGPTTTHPAVWSAFRLYGNP